MSRKPAKRSTKDGVKQSVKQSAGRPARLSHEQILDAAMALIGREGGEAFSLRKLARALETVPGNLYTYFPHREALFDAMAERALAALDDQFAQTAAWDEDIRQWMEALRNAIRSQPALLYIIGVAGSSPGAVRRIDAIARRLHAEGLTERESVLQAQSLLWAVMSFTLFEMQAGEKKVVEQLTQAGAYEDFPTVMQHLALQDLEPLWQATLVRSVAGLRGLIEGDT